MEFIIILFAVSAILILAGYELFEGIFASGAFNGDDEENFFSIGYSFFASICCWFIIFWLIDCRN